MHYKIKHISWVFIIYIAVFLFAAIALYYTIHFFNNQKKALNKEAAKIELLHEYQDRMEANARVFSELHMFEDSFIKDGGNASTNEFHNYYQQSADVINNLNLYNKFSPLKSYNDSLKGTLNAYNNTFRELYLSYRECGNNNVGLIHAIHIQNWEIISALNEPAISKLAIQLKKQTELYLNDPSEITYGKCKNTIDDCISACYAVNKETFNQLGFIEGFNSIRSGLDELNQKFKRIGLIYNQSGYLNDYATIRDIYLAEINTLHELANSLVQKITIFINLKFYFILLLIIGGYLILSYFIFNKVVWHNNKILALTKKLALGQDINKHEIKQSGYEYENIYKAILQIDENNRSKEKFIDLLLNKNFDTPYKQVSEYDKLGLKLNTLLNLLKDNEEERLKNTEISGQRSYINEGITEFGNIMRNNSNNLEKLSDEFVKALVKYLNAVQGGLFLIDDDTDDKLKLYASYAFNRKKFINKTVKKGDGLVGSCALEKGTIVLEDLPAGYLEITSGLGDAPPNNLILVPCLHEGILKGVIEMASLLPFNKIQIELLESIASNLASTLITVQNNQKNATLLKKSQEQAAEMSEQEEEMRQNMEELKATQEESQRREEELLRVISAADRSFFVLHYDTNSTIKHISDRLVKFLRIGEKEMIGKHHTDVFGKNSIITEQVIENALTAGQINLIENFTYRDTSYKLKYHLSPLEHQSGVVDGVINFISVDEIEDKNK